MPLPSEYPPHRRRVSVNVKAAGTYRLHLHMSPGHQQPLGSPLVLLVRPAPPYAALCRSLASQSDCHMLAGEKRSFSVRTFDIYGNACDVGGAEVSLGSARLAPWDSDGKRVLRKTNNPSDDVPGDVSAGSSSQQTLQVSYQVADYGNGSYRVMWTCAVAGVHPVEVSVDGVPLERTCEGVEHAGAPDGVGVPLSLTVEPNVLSIHTTKLSGDGLCSATAGDAAIVRVHGTDDCGNAIRASQSISFGISLWDARRRRHVHMQSGAAHGGPQARSTGTGNVYIHDVSGDSSTGGVRATATGGNEDRDSGGSHKDRELWGTLNGYWLNDGVFELAYTCSTAGRYDVHIWYRDASGGVQEVPNVSGPLEVLPAVADCRGSMMLEPHALAYPNLASDPAPVREHSVLMAGSFLSASVLVADRLGNACTLEHRSDLVVCIDGPIGNVDLGCSTPAVAVAAGSSPGLYKSCDDAVELRLSGSYRLSACLRGQHVQGSPLDFSVTAAPPDGDHSELVHPSTAPISHLPATFLITCRDKFGNAPPPSELTKAVAVGSIAARVDGPTKPMCALRALHDGSNDGSVELTVLAKLSGEYQLHVWVGGTAVGGLKAHALHVHPRPFARSASASGSWAMGLPHSRRASLPRSPSHTFIPSVSPSTRGRRTSDSLHARHHHTCSPRTSYPGMTKSPPPSPRAEHTDAEATTPCYHTTRTPRYDVDRTPRNGSSSPRLSPRHEMSRSSYSRAPRTSPMSAVVRSPRIPTFEPALSRERARFAADRATRLASRLSSDVDILQERADGDRAAWLLETRGGAWLEAEARAAGLREWDALRRRKADREASGREKSAFSTTKTAIRPPTSPRGYQLPSSTAEYAKDSTTSSCSPRTAERTTSGKSRHVVHPGEVHLSPSSYSSSALGLAPMGRCALDLEGAAGQTLSRPGGTPFRRGLDRELAEAEDHCRSVRSMRDETAMDPDGWMRLWQNDVNTSVAWD